MRALFILVVVGLLSAGCFWLHQQSQATVQSSRPVERHGQALSIHAPGVVEGIGRQLDLRLQLGGRVVEVPVHEGDFVQQGDLLVQLDDATQRHQVAMLQGELAYTQARLERLKNGAHPQERLEAKAILESRLAKLTHAEHEMERVNRLLSKNAVGEQELDRWKSEVKSLQSDVEAAKARHDLLVAPARDDELRAAEAQVSMSQAKLQLAQTELSRTALRAPVAGEILDVNHEPGELIELNDQEPAIVMADTSRLRVRAYVEELDAVSVTPGMEARITADGLPGYTATGRVVEIMPRMSFKQVWTDRPDERFDVKTREVLVEILDEAPAGADASASTRHKDVSLVYGLPVEVELQPHESTSHAQAMLQTQLPGLTRDHRGPP
jgi:multidrug resistance efflux pump